MNLCLLSSDFIKERFTSIDNIFLGGYMTSADGLDVKIYLYSVFVAGLPAVSDENTPENIALSLRVSKERLMDGYKYWQEVGLVTISNSIPERVVFHSAKNALPPAIRRSASEFSAFTEEMSRLFPNRVLMPNELNTYIDIMSQYKIEQNAMLMIVKYCIELKSNEKLGMNYIVAVASDWGKKGIQTESQVEEHICQLEQNNEAIRSIFVALGLKRAADLDDRQLYLKWTKTFNFGLDAILIGAKACKKRGGMPKLDTLLEEFRANGAFTSVDINEYVSNKDFREDLAQSVIDILGVHYSNTNMVIETYLQKWLDFGFTEDALKVVAKYCFRKNIKTLESMHNIVLNLQKRGAVSQKSIENFISHQVAIDTNIRQLLDSAGTSVNISNRDRDFYKLWADEWGFEQDMLDFLATESFGKPFPFVFMNKVLSKMKSDNSTDIDGAKKALSDLNHDYVKTKKKKDTYIEHEYSKEELDNIFSNFDVFDFQ